MTRKYKEIAIIPDSHATPDNSNDRFSWAGELMVSRQPDIIVDIGDSADMASLSHYDVGKVSAEGRRYKDDIAAYQDAMNKFMAPINKYNSTSTKHKKKKYQPRLIKCRGNHEHRIARAANDDPKLHGHLSYDDLQETKYGWEVHDFLKPIEAEGIVFQHYFTSGVMGRSIGGDNHAASLVKKNLVSSVCGHSHLRDFSETTDAMGRKRFGLVVGCYVDYDMHYTLDQERWWSGLVYLHDVREGMAEPEWLHVDYLRRRFS